MTEEINLGSLVVELRADDRQLLSDVQASMKRAAETIQSELQKGFSGIDLAPLINQQKQLNAQQQQAAQQSQQANSSQLDALTQQIAQQQARQNIARLDLDLQKEKQAAELKELELEKQKLQMQGQVSAELEQRIADQKRSLAFTETELSKYAELRQSVHEYNEALKASNYQRSNALAYISQFADRQRQLTDQVRSNAETKAQLDQQKALNSVLDEAITKRREIDQLISNSSTKSRSVQESLALDVNKIRADRSITTAYGAGAIGQAAAKRDASKGVEDAKYEQQLVEAKRSYLSQVNAIVAATRTQIDLLKQAGAAEEQILEAEAKQRSGVQQLLSNYKQIRAELGSTHAERLTSIDAEFGKTRNAANSFKNFFQKEIIEGALNAFGSGLLAIPGKISGAFLDAFRGVINTITGLINSSLESFKKYESVKSTINIASQGQGDKAFPVVEKISEKYKIPIADAAESYRGLVAAGLAAGRSLDEVNFIFERFIMTSRAFNASTADTKGVLEAVTQILSKNKVQAEELRGQLGDRLPGAVALFAKSLGVSTAELDKMLQSGSVTAEALLPFAAELEKAYGSRLGDALKTTTATADGLQNAIFKLQKDFGESINPINQAALEAASTILEGISRDVFVNLNAQAKAFKAYLDANPAIVQNISDRISKLLREGLDGLASKAKEFLEYLNRNPGAIDQAVKKAEELVRLFAAFAGYCLKAVEGITAAAQKMEQLMSIPGVKEFLLGSPTQNLNKGALGLGITAGTEGFKTGLFTGPSANNGGSSEYHVDVKIPDSLTKEQAVALFDQIGHGYYASGKHIVFSNEGVAGQAYDLNDPQRGDLLMRAFAAHSHSVHPGWRSVDFYAPNLGADQFDKSAEGVEMIAPNIAGGKVNYASGGNYGNYLTIADSSGNVVFKMGHGDDSKPLPADRNLGGSSSTTSTPSGETLSPGERSAAQRAREGNSNSNKPVTTLPADKTKPPVEIGQGKNVNQFLSGLAYLESTFNPNEYNTSSGASGAFQFMATTANGVMAKGIPDPRKGSLEDQARATWRWIEKDFPNAAKAIKDGNFETAFDLLKGTWPSLPGGTQQQGPERMAEARQYFSGAKTRINIGTGSTDKNDETSAGTSAETLYQQKESELKSYQDATKRAERDTAKRQLDNARRRRDAAFELLKAEATGSDEATKTLSMLGEIQKITDQKEDAAREGNYALADKKAGLDQLRKKPLQFGENKDARDKTIKALEADIRSIEKINKELDETAATQIKAITTRYEAEARIKLKEFEAQRKSNAIDREIRYQQTTQAFEAASTDLNSYDSQRLQLRQADERQELENKRARAPIEAELEKNKKSLEILDNIVKKLPEAQQKTVKDSSGYKLSQKQVEEGQAQLNDIGSNDFLRRQTTERKAQAIDKQQAKAQQDAIRQSSDEQDSLIPDQLKRQFLSAGFTEATATLRSNAAAKQIEINKINRDLELTIERSKEAGNYTAELEHNLRETAAIKIDGLNNQFKTLSETIRDELLAQLREFYSSLDGGFKSFFQNVITGNKSIGDSFKDLFNSILTQLATLAVNRLFTQLFAGKGIGGLFEPGGLPQEQRSPGIGSAIGNIASAFIPGAAPIAGLLGSAIPGFANGGIVGANGRGTLALLAEAGMNEAVIPLPNGKSVPIDMKGSNVGSINSQADVTVTINNNGSTSISSSAAGQLGRVIDARVQAGIVEALRPNGLLSNR